MNNAPLLPAKELPVFTMMEPDMPEDATNAVVKPMFPDPLLTLEPLRTVRSPPSTADEDPAEIVTEPPLTEEEPASIDTPPAAPATAAPTLIITLPPFPEPAKPVFTLIEPEEPKTSEFPDWMTTCPDEEEPPPEKT